jgi:hypothetical protein
MTPLIIDFIRLAAGSCCAAAILLLHLPRGPIASRTIQEELRVHHMSLTTSLHPSPVPSR